MEGGECQSELAEEESCLRLLFKASLGIRGIQKTRGEGDLSCAGGCWCVPANMMMLWTSLGTFLLELIRTKASHDPAQPWTVLFPQELEDEVVSHLPVGFFVSVGA